MAVVITDLCIACGSCIDECPVGAIVDEDDNFDADDIYYVHSNVCVECIGFNDEPACSSVCPVKGCIVWGDVSKNSIFRTDIDANVRDGHRPVHN